MNPHTTTRTLAHTSRRTATWALLLILLLAAPAAGLSEARVAKQPVVADDPPPAFDVARPHFALSSCIRGAPSCDPCERQEARCEPECNPSYAFGLPGSFTTCAAWAFAKTCPTLFCHMVSFNSKQPIEPLQPSSWT